VILYSERLPDGRLLIPATAEADDGTRGHGRITIGPDDPRYEVWDEMTPTEPESTD
jgi:hypothetical protein